MGKQLKVKTRSLLHNTFLQIIVLLIRQRLGSSVRKLLLVLGHNFWVDLDLGRSQSGSSNEFQSLVANKLAGEPQEWLFEVVVRLSRNIVVLKVLLAVECDGLGLDLALLHINLVTAENNGDVFADSDQVTVPVGNVLVGDTGCNVEHDDTALAVDVVTITETTELLLTSSVPDIELNRSQVGGESKRVDFYTQGGNVLLLELSSQVTLDESGLSSTTVTDEDELECGNLFGHIDGMT